jgi:hypothetical protein
MRWKVTIEGMDEFGGRDIAEMAIKREFSQLANGEIGLAQSPARNPYEPATLCFDHRAFKNAGQPSRQRFISSVRQRRNTESQAKVPPPEAEHPLTGTSASRVRRRETVRQYFAIARYNLAVRKRVDYATIWRRSATELSGSHESLFLQQIVNVNWIFAVDGNGGCVTAITYKPVDLWYVRLNLGRSNVGLRG